MKQLNFSEVAELVNHSQTTQIEPDPVMNGGDWDLYVGRYRIHAHEHEFHVLYLRSTVSRNGLLDARSRGFKPGYQVVYAPSLNERSTTPTSLRSLFEEEASGFWNLREYLQSFFANEHESYKKALKELAPSDYIEPQVRVPAGGRRTRLNPLHSFLVDPAQGREQLGTLGVLLAGPGQGKTYMTQHLVTAVMHRDFFPIYIRSDQWQTMSLEDIGSLWKTIGHSFRHFRTPIGWIEGREDQFIRTSLKAGLFTIIFDGLDEYLLRNHERVSASDVLSALIELVSDTGARIVVTSRTTLWNAEFASEIDQNQHTPQVAIYQIEPFDQDHARQYFRKKLSDDIQINNALQLFSRLRRSASELIGRGFVLKLVADLFEGNQEEPTEVPEKRQPLLWLMEALCERDRKRQNLRLTASEQLKALKIFFSELVQGELSDSNTLSYSIGLAASGLDADAIAECVNNMSSHALLHCVDSGRDEWETPERQIQMALLASYVIDIALLKPDQTAINIFCQRGRLNKEQSGVLSETVIDLISALTTSLDEFVEQIHNLVRKLSHGFKHRGAVENKGSDIRRLLMMIVVSALDHLPSMGGSKERVDRTEYFIDMLPSREIRSLHFFGTIARQDFSGRQFENCLFEETKWTYCKFDQRTRFVKCRFVGGSNEHCSGFGLANWEELTGDEAGLRMINAAQVVAGQRRYNEEDLRTDIKSVIDKFVVSGSPRFRTIREDSILSGPIMMSKHRDEILKAIKRYLLERHHISGSARHGLHIRDEVKECMSFYAVNSMFTGPLQEVYFRLRNRLVS